MIAPSGPAYLLPTSIILLTFVTISAINPGCQCVQYSSIPGDKQWGQFTSPDYPANYPRGIGCLLFSFQAPKDHIVQISFQLIRLPQPRQGCHLADYLKLFLHTEGEGVNERTPWNSLICGDYENQTFASASRHLIIQFHSSSIALEDLLRHVVRPAPPGTTFGFRGVFRFLNATQFESNGRLVPGTKCDYRFVSENFTSPEGKFFSPLYPSMYPHNTMCAYHFTAGPEERVSIVFESVTLQLGKYSCLNKTDLIRIFDGPNTRSPVIAVICNEVLDFEVTSTSRELFIEFIANSDSPGSGFRARYKFAKIVIENQFDALENFKQYFANKGLIRYGEDGLPQASTLVPQCNQVISSDGGRNGSFSTPNFPNPYPPKAHCRFEFIGHGRERVHIVFVDFDLFHHHSEKINFNIPQESADYDDQEEDVNVKNVEDYIGGGGLGRKGKKRRKGAIKDSDKIFKQLSREGTLAPAGNSKCLYADSIAAFVYVDGEERKLLRHCGANPPPNLMSNSHRMTVEFRARATTTAPAVRGFYAQYFFVENLGVTSGRQLANYPCAFIFNSSEMKNGTFSSPNYPGLYPQDTECHYFFHAVRGYHVEIHFERFDVRGILPCEEDWDDYVELSDHMPMENSLYTRRCDQEPFRNRFSVRSESVFFRVSFKSNDRYDGSGFHARFQFTDKINQIRTIVNVNSASRSSYFLFQASHRGISSIVQLVIILVILKCFSLHQGYIVTV